MSQSVLKSEVLLPQFYVFIKPYFFCPKIYLSLFFFVITRDILWFFWTVSETFIIFLFLFIPCLLSRVFLPVLHFYIANYSFSFFGPTPSLWIPILCMFMPMFKECKSVTSIPSSWHLNLHLLRYIFSACSRINRRFLRVFTLFSYCFHTVLPALCFYYIVIREWSGKNHTSYWVSWQVG